jgi:hypothetical protein
MKKFIMIILLFAGFQVHATIIDDARSLFGSRSDLVDGGWAEVPEKSDIGTEAGPSEVESLVIHECTFEPGVGPVCPIHDLPEPSILALFAAGLIAISIVRRRRS